MQETIQRGTEWPISDAGTPFRALGRNVLLKNLSETSRLFQIAFFVVVARRFGPASFGELTVLLMIGAVVGLVFGDLGINTTTIAMMNGKAGDERRCIASTAARWKIGLSMLALLLMVIVMRIAVPKGAWAEILAVAGISCATLWHDFLAAMTNGINRLDTEALLRLAYRALVYGAGALLCFFSNLAVVLVFMAAGGFAVLAIAFATFSARLGLRHVAGSPMLSGFLRESLPVWITQVAQLACAKFDLVILGLLHVASRETGWYAGAWKVTDILSIMPLLLAAAALPLMSGALAGIDASHIAPTYLKLMYVLPYFVVLPLAIGANCVTTLLYGSKFEGTPVVLRLLVWVLAPVCVHTFLVTAAVASRRQSEAAKLGIITAIVGLVSAAVLVPRFGYLAMAVISVGTNWIFALIMVYRFRTVTGPTQAGVCLKALASAVGIYGFGFVLAGRIGEPLMMAVGTLGYLGALLVLGVVTFRDLSRISRFAGSMLWNRSDRRVESGIGL